MPTFQLRVFAVTTGVPCVAVAWVTCSSVARTPATVIPVAGDGPEFVTSMVHITSAPTKAGLELPVTWIDRSADGGGTTVV